MGERERLIELIGKANYVGLETFNDRLLKSGIERLADQLLENGVIVPPCNRVYFIIDKGTPFEYVGRVGIDYLKIYEIKDLSKYGYYTTKEEALKALKRRCNK